jgi:tetratricopeptide (TPR) repeat protein
MHLLADVPRSRRRRLFVAALLLAASSGGCSTLRSTLRAYDLGPDGIARSQHRLREALAAGDFVRALAWHEEDELLDRLSRATSAYYAGQFLRAGALLDTSALVSDDRVTERLSRDALALVTNDLARPYRPRRTERLFIPYYGMLAYARAESWEDAAVEARRLTALIAQYGDDRDDAERSLHAAFEHLAGAVLERAGRPDEARVAYRAAHGILAQAPESVAKSAPNEGELLVVLERGFVAHRVTEKIDVYVGDDDAHHHRGDPRRDENEESNESDRETPAVADPRHTSNASSVPAGGTFASDSARPPRRRRRHNRDDDGDYWIAIAFPALRQSARPHTATTQLLVDSARSDLHLSTVVDDAASADERRERLAMLARATARAGAKYALAKAVKDKKGETAGTLTNYGASLLERADVRSWHLLPREIELLRVRVPAGVHGVRVELTDGGTTRTLDLGTFAVRVGTVTVVPFRVWREGTTPTASLAAPRP